MLRGETGVGTGWGVSPLGEGQKFRLKEPRKGPDAPGTAYWADWGR